MSQKEKIMFKKETEYALRALVYICEQNQQDRRPGLTEIAEEIEAPAPFSAKVLQRLVKSGVLSSQKGKGGGFFFRNDQGNTILKDVVILTEGSGIFTNCGFGLGHCNDENPCPIHDQYLKVREQLEEIFSKNTIRDLALREQSRQSE